MVESNNNDVNYLIFGPNGNLYYITSAEIGQYEIPKDSEKYKKFANDTVTNAIQTAAVIVDTSGTWHPFGATCIVPFAMEEQMVEPQKLAYINLDFNMDASFNKTLKKLEDEE